MDPEAEALILRLHAAGKSDDEIHAALTQAGFRQAPEMPRMASESTKALLPSEIAQVEHAKTKAMGTISGGLRAAEQGLTLGFGDEINAGARALFGGEKYGEAVKDERAKLKEQETNAPLVSAGLSLVGAALPFGAVGAARKAGLMAAKAAPEIGALTTGAKLAKGAKIGAAYGAVAGAGSADPDPAQPMNENLKHRLFGATKGAAAGATFGAAVPAAARAAEGIANTPVARGVVDMADRLGARLKGMGTTGAVNLTPTENRAESAAMRLVGKRLERAKVDPANVKLPDADVPYVLGDVGKKQTHLLAGAVASVPGEGASELPEFAAERALGRRERVAKRIFKETGAQEVQPALRPGQIDEAMRPGVDQLYSAARNAGSRVVISPETRQLLQTPEVEQALGKAQKVSKLGAAVGHEPNVAENIFTTNAERRAQEGMTPELQDDLRAWLRAGKDPNSWGSARVVRPDIDANTLHQVIKGVGDQIAATEGDKGPLVANYRRHLTALKESLAKDLTEHAPAFKAADEAFSTMQGTKDAAEGGAAIGRNLGQHRTDEVQGMLEGKLPLPGQKMARELSQAQRGELQDNAASGLAQSVMETKGGSHALLDPEHAVAVDPKLSLLFGPHAAQALRDANLAEHEMRALERAITSGSRTTPLALDVGELTAQPVADFARKATSRGISSATLGALRSSLSGLVDRWSQGVSSDIAGATGKLLLKGRGGRLELLDALIKLAEQRQQQLKLAAAMQKASAVGGNLRAQGGANP